MSPSSAPPESALPAVAPDSPTSPADPALIAPEVLPLAAEAGMKGQDAVAVAIVADAPPLLAEPPPLLPEPPLLIAEPPLLPAPAPAPVTTPRLTTPWIIALVVVGLLQLFLGFRVPYAGPLAGDAAFRIGTVIGGTAFWPLVVIGLFSIGRRFRNGPARAKLLLFAWCFCIVGHLGNIGKVRSTPPNFRRDVLDGPVTRRAFDLPEAPRPRVAPAVPAAPAVPSSLDFSPGSNERLVKMIERAQEERYHEIVAAYAAACAAAPDNAELAVERVKFIDHFRDSEDTHIDSAESDHDEARRDLDERFPSAPPAVLYRLETTYGRDFDRRAAEYVRQVERWPAPLAAKYYLLRAERADRDDKAATVREFAAQSYQRQPTPEAGILLAQSLVTLKRHPEAVRVLAGSEFMSAPDWINKQRMDLLFELKQTALAMAVFEQLKQTTPALVKNFETAKLLARANRVTEARALLGEMDTTDWDGPWLARRRFDFELEFGTAPAALSAYRTLRATGFMADPLARDRFELLRRHPSAAWALSDVLGFALLGLSLVAVGFAPLLLLAPVHHWSLWRKQRGRATTWEISPWGLRGAWVALGGAFVAELIGIWYFYPATIRSWLGGREFIPVMNNISPLPAQTVAWTALTLVALLLLWRGRAWRLVGGGGWTWDKAIGVGIGFGFVLRAVVGVYVVLVPGARPVLAQISPVTTELAKSIVASLGPWGLLAVVGLFVPILEEILFRGVLLGAMAKHIPFNAANALQALAFAAVHENIWLFPFFFGFAFLAGSLVRRSHGLLAAIAMHATNNLVASLGLFLLQLRSGG